MPIYLYVKTHRKTGLKYLGKTEKKDPHKYHGSGTGWREHIKEHGYDVDTDILRECQTYDELEEWGMYYSNLWNVVESSEWANRIPETGEGIGKKMWEDPTYREDQSRKASERMKDRWKDPKYRSKQLERLYKMQKQLREDPAYREKQSEISSNVLKKMWEDPEYRAMKGEETIERNYKRWEDSENKAIQSEITKKQWEDPEYRATVSATMSAHFKKQWKNSDYREQQIERVKRQWEDPEFKASRSGKNHPKYDHTIYHFIHKDGREETCTRHELCDKYELCRNEICAVIRLRTNSHKGWRLKKD